MRVPALAALLQAYASVGDKLFYAKDRYLRMHEFASGRDVPVVSLRRSGHSQVTAAFFCGS